MRVYQGPGRLSTSGILSLLPWWCLYLYHKVMFSQAWENSEQGKKSPEGQKQTLTEVASVWGVMTGNALP